MGTSVGPQGVKLRLATWSRCSARRFDKRLRSGQGVACRAPRYRAACGDSDLAVAAHGSSWVHRRSRCLAFR